MSFFFFFFAFLIRFALIGCSFCCLFNAYCLVLVLKLLLGLKVASAFCSSFYVFVLRIHTALVAASVAAVLQTAALIPGCLATAITRKREEQDEQLIAGYSAIFSVQRSSFLTLVSFPRKVLLPL